MRLLYLNHNYRQSGTFYRAMPMAREMAACGHDVTMFTVSRTRKWRPQWTMEAGVRLGEMPHLAQNNSGEGYGPLDNLLRLLHGLAYPYDVVHMFDHKPNATFAGFANRLRGSVLVSDWADWWGGPGGINDVPHRRIPAVGRFEEWWETRTKQWSDGVVTISQVLRERALAIGCAPERVLYLPTGAATERIRPVPLEQARAALNLPLDRRIVGFIGMGQGDLEIVMEAIRPLDDVWLMVVGYKNERVQQQADALGVGERLWRTGFVADDEVPLYLGAANVMCLPMADTAANRGRLPNKLLDYMCAGRPTVASPVGDVRTIVQTHGGGVLAANIGEFSRTLAQLLSDPEQQRQIGARARQVAETEFVWDGLLDRLERFYAELLQQQ